MPLRLVNVRLNLHHEQGHREPSHSNHQEEDFLRPNAHVSQEIKEANGADLPNRIDRIGGGYILAPCINR